MDTKFLADSMLGKLAKWLRIMGYDTHYQTIYKEEEMEELVKAGHKLLSRHRATIKSYSNALLIRSDHVGNQLRELKLEGSIRSGRGGWFSRCLICNMPLKRAEITDVRESVPEYIYYQNIVGIRFCPSCDRFFWPGSHRRRMIQQLERWGFRDIAPE